MLLGQPFDRAPRELHVCVQEDSQLVASIPERPYQTTAAISTAMAILQNLALYVRRQTVCVAHEVPKCLRPKPCKCTLAHRIRDVVYERCKEAKQQPNLAEVRASEVNGSHTPHHIEVRFDG